MSAGSNSRRTEILLSPIRSPNRDIDHHHRVRDNSVGTLEVAIGCDSMMCPYLQHIIKFSILFQGLALEIYLMYVQLCYVSEGKKYYDLGSCTKKKVKSMSNISPTTASVNQLLNEAGSESIWAQKCVRDKKWCHIPRRQISNSMTYG